MNFYDTDKIFIGMVGYKRPYNDKQTIFKFEEFAIVYKKSWSLECDYYDIFTSKEYTDFYSYYCMVGAPAILKPKSFTAFLYEYLKDYPEETNNKFTKILKTKRIRSKDLRTLLNDLNNAYRNEKEQNPNNINNNDYTSYNRDKNNTANLNFDYANNLTNKTFKVEPAIGRDFEVKEVIITLAQDKKNPILVGPSGTGKTTIAEQLAYKIQKNEVPDFLKKKQIIELDMTSLLAGTKYVGALEEKFKNLIDYSIKNNSILFINEIHTIYGAGSTSKSDNDVAGMLKQAIDRQGLKIIGTTTSEEYDKYFSNDALKRRFEKVLVKEPNNKSLYQIIYKVFDDFSKNNNIKLINNIDNIINILIELTKEKHRVYDDKICNPDLAISIIDKIFADAKVNNQKKLTIDNIVYGIKNCNRIYDSCKEECINNLNCEEVEKQKIIKFIPFKK